MSCLTAPGSCASSLVSVRDQKTLQKRCEGEEYASIGSDRILVPRSHALFHMCPVWKYLGHIHTNRCANELLLISHSLYQVSAMAF